MKSGTFRVSVDVMLDKDTPAKADEGSVFPDGAGQRLGPVDE